LQKRINMTPCGLWNTTAWWVHQYGLHREKILAGYQEILRFSEDVSGKSAPAFYAAFFFGALRRLRFVTNDSPRFSSALRLVCSVAI